MLKQKKHIVEITYRCPPYSEIIVSDPIEFVTTDSHMAEILAIDHIQDKNGWMASIIEARCVGVEELEPMPLDGMAVWG